LADDRFPLFVMHIPKTAGTSFAWLARQQYPPADVCSVYPGHHEQILAARDWIRTAPSPRAVIGHFRFGLHDGLVSNPRYVTLLRDPVDQVVSNFNYMVASDDPFHRAVVPPGSGIDAYADHDWAGNLQTQFLLNCSRMDIEEDPEEAYRRAVDTIDTHFAGIGTVELLTESVQGIARRLEWLVLPVPWLNSTPSHSGRVHRRDLPPATLNRIRAANQCDARLHAYVTRLVWSTGNKRATRFRTAARRVLARFAPASRPAP
jgi:hypothetical protein